MTSHRNHLQDSGAGGSLIERARTLAHHLEKEAGRPGAASVINDLVAEIERLREAAKGAVIIANIAGTQLVAKDAQIAKLTSTGAP